MQCREQAQREASPTAAIIDSQIVKSTEKERWLGKFAQRAKWSSCLTAAGCGSGETMTKRVCRNHSPALKANLALAALKGEKTLADLARQFDVHVNQIKQCTVSGKRC